MAQLEIHKKKELQLCLRALLLQADSTTFIQQIVNGGSSGESPKIESQEMVQLLRDSCSGREHLTIDQLYGIVEMLHTVWMKEDRFSDQLVYSRKPSIYNALLYFVDQGSLILKDNTFVTCHWECLLRWHTLSSAIGEDLLVCAYLAAYDLRNVQIPKQRNDFAWPSYIRTDNSVLEAMLEMPLADIHSHLKGSSLNFDINWICLMNHIDDRKHQFDRITRFAQGNRYNRNDTIGLYGKAVVAAAIRLYLAQLAVGANEYTIQELMGLLKTLDGGTILNKVNDLQQTIETSLNIYGKPYSDEMTGKTARLDYAIIEGMTVPRGKQEMCAYSLLSGERHILYRTLTGIYNGTYDNGVVATLFYIYLLIKNEIRHEISQLNETVGFHNFSIYEDRKMLFVKPHEEYKKAAIHLAVASFFGEHEKGSRYHEARITPEVSDAEEDNVVEKNIREIEFNDDAIENRMFRTRDDAEHGIWDYRYIYHFIKDEDDMEDGKLDAVERHHHLREKVKQQAIGICDLRNSLERNKYDELYADRVVGIDAANSEIYCRPEVFAQAFRFLRRHEIRHKEKQHPQDLGITYHVGEDFMDVVDGLRAVDEAIQFLPLQEGDRIGHGLVLGVDVKEYYRIRNYTVAKSLQMHIDDAAWLWDKMTQMGIRNASKDVLERHFGKCFRRVYPHYGGTPSIDLYRSSMLLRGDNPQCYDAVGKVTNKYDRVTGWGNKALVRSKVCDEARKQREACKLYYMYHFDKNAKINGRTFETWEMDEEMIRTIEKVQENLLRQVEIAGIAIECNPTSNFKIGEIERYDQHPITKFRTIGWKKSKYQVSASINTDDKGVFVTSIEREYALIAHALIRKYRYEGGELTNDDVFGWLDDIRLQSLYQRFDKTVRMQEYPYRSTLLKLKENIRAEIRKEIRRKGFFERVKMSLGILFGK